MRCISFDSYIKPQPELHVRSILSVVYLLIPTSNHNLSCIVSFGNQLYIFWFLHQTTTVIWAVNRSVSCISFDSYIKPQPVRPFSMYGLRCISFDSYIKPQPYKTWVTGYNVVYLLIPTSNHNVSIILLTALKLYIFWFLHQTTTGLVTLIIWIRCISFDSYIKPQPAVGPIKIRLCCISFDSYIKPQLIHYF